MVLLLGLALGCTTLPGTPSGFNADGTPLKRQPQPATCVAYGELHEKAALDPGRSPGEQEELRNKARLGYQQALQINSKDLPALLALARLYTSEGDFDRALATYDRAIGAHPNNALPRYELGMCHGRRKNWNLALQSLQKAVELDPENRGYRHTYGLCLARAQRWDESLAVLTKLEGPANAHYELARMLHHLDQDQASKEHLRLALVQNPEHFGAQQLLEALETGTPDLAYPITPAGAENPGNPSHPLLGRPVRAVQP